MPYICSPCLLLILFRSFTKFSYLPSEGIFKIMDSTAEENKYATCCANEYGDCGPYLRYRKPVDELFEISDLTNDTKPHLVRLKLKHTKSGDTFKLSSKLMQ